MVKRDIFSKRNSSKNLTQDFIHDYLPDKLINQINFIWEEALGSNVYVDRSFNEDIWIDIHRIVCKEHGVRELGQSQMYRNDKEVECKLFFRSDYLGGFLDMKLDLIEVSFQKINNEARRIEDYARKFEGISVDPDEAIDELNERFKENGVGYQFKKEMNILVKLDEDYIYDDIIIPAAKLLTEEGFDGASDEFIKSQNYYKSGDNKAAISEANKAFESTMKIICHKLNWDYNPSKDTAKALINTIIKNGLIPSYNENYLSSLNNSLQGLATIRNKESGHGQGHEVKEIPDYLVSFSIYQCANNIIFLVEAYKDKKRELNL